MRRRRPIELFSISFLDLLSGALGAVIILYVAIPKNQPKTEDPTAIVKMQESLNSHQKTIDELKKQLDESAKKLASVPKPAPPVVTPVATPAEPSSNLDVGFKFKGKDIVFIIDTSLSMVEENRIGQVQAGLKMFMTSLSGNYRVDIVQFPLAQRAPFRAMWGVTKEFKTENRNDAFEFVYALKPSGGTPTRDTLLFVLRNYNYISDIVLLTDGLPTFHNSNRKEDIHDILRAVKENNPNKIQINTIGVGSDFIRDPNSDQYKFLSTLSSENNGFFVGF